MLPVRYVILVLENTQQIDPDVMDTKLEGDEDDVLHQLWE